MPQARICDQTFYNWTAKYGGLEISEAKRLKGLDSENAKLKKCWPMTCWTMLLCRISWQKDGDARC